MVGLLHQTATLAFGFHRRQGRVARQLCFLVSEQPSSSLLSTSPSRFPLKEETSFSKATTSSTTRSTLLSVSSTASSSAAASIHQDDDGNCIFGKKSYWDEMYENGSIDDRPCEKYSWYCGWDELKPFWTGLVVVDDVSNKYDDYSNIRVLIAGIGNDPTPVHMYDSGWTNMTAFDYSEAGVRRAKDLFGRERLEEDAVRLLVADARSLPLKDASVDATLDKGTLDAIYITGKEAFEESVKELGRITTLSTGMVVCVSRVIEPDVFLNEFDTPLWDVINDGTLAFAPDGEATIDLGAELYAWRRTDVPFVS